MCVCGCVMVCVLVGCVGMCMCGCVFCIILCACVVVVSVYVHVLVCECAL